MSRLFWKFFLAFWLTMAVFAVLSLYSTSAYLEHLRESDEFSSLREKRDSYLQEADRILSSQGIEVLKEWLEEIDSREAVPFLLLDSRYRDLLNRPVSAGLLKRLQAKPDEAEKAARYEDYKRRYSLKDVNGQVYYFVADFKAISLERLLTRPQVLLLPVLIALLMSFLLSILLAGYLVWPIRRLGVATRQLASGQLDHRVRPELGRRRDELADLAGDFDEMAAQLQRLLESNRQLLSDVSHELRSPLARIQVAVDRIHQTTPAAPVELLDRIERETGRLDRLISQLLSLNRLSVSGAAAVGESISLLPLLQQVVDDAEFEASANNCSVMLELSGSLKVTGNRELLFSTLDNLLRNAIRYSPVGGRISVVLNSRRENMATIIVEDEGPGIPESMISEVFEPFVRVDKARDRKSGGHGLGLAIASRSVKVHGGSIRAENRPEGGLRMVIELPLSAGGDISAERSD